ncbi:ABC transporter ATP-binding protein [Streptomyces odontomachi]|uniref:ABC transporter ATP-binding protein n=1 Tax=Streptomyces odontomachi TaxID=2944940 RepID=UPI002109485C|nr:ABC transporter ATP-binding protein [Streptomyces sp. ODS25]
MTATGATTATTTKPVLGVRDLSVTFGAQAKGGRGGRPVHAVDGLCYELAPGEVLAVVGESGCGKSVSAMAVMGLLPSTAQLSGSVTLGGRELVGAGEKELRRVRGKDIAMIFQEPMTSLNPVLTVGRQVGEVLRRHQGLNRREARERAAELLTLVGIPAPDRRLDEYPHQLSGGMRQRVMIALAVACDPAVLIADEPTTALDVTVQAGILEVLKNLRNRLGTSIVLITHDLGVVADIADRVLVMYAGRAVEHAPVHELFAAPRHPYTRGLLSAVLRPGPAPDNADRPRLTEIPGLVPSLDTQPDACTFAPRCARADEQCTASRPLLGDTDPDDAATDATTGVITGTPAGVITSDTTGAPTGTHAPHQAACWHPHRDALVRTHQETGQ